MADKTQLEVVIAPDGTVTITTHGLRGQACIEETKSLESAIGTVRSRQKTPEFYAASSATKTSIKGR